MEVIPLTSFAFPTCTLWVFDCYRQCLTDPTIVEINITSIQAKLPYCGQCESFIQWLRSGDEWQQARRGRNLVINLFRIICDNTWNRFLDAFPPEFWPYCDQPQGTRKKFTYWLASRKAYCYTQYPITDPNIRLFITTIDCMEQFCCGRKREYCVDRATGQTRITEERIVGSQVPCDNYIPHLTQCPPGLNVTVTSCIDNYEDTD